MHDANWEPRIVAFFCNWCTYTAADLAGVSRLKYAPNVRIVRLMCSGRVDPQFVLAALAGGADGVLIGGCHLGDCHYAEGNLKALRRFELLKRLLADFGIEDDRVQLEWISAAEGDKVRSVINGMVERLRPLGPLAWSGRFGAEGREAAAAAMTPEPEVAHV
jgi:F420-non-reducing hydrogenase iron-sulfur subunit